MRFLFINQYYAPDFAATAQILTDLCEGLAAAGHEVHVLAGRALYDGRQLELPEYEVLNGVHVHRVGATVSSRARYRDRLMGYASFYWRAFLAAHKLERADIVCTLTTPPLIALLGAWLRVVRRSRLVFWVMDVYPDIAIKSGVLSRMGPTRTIWSALGRLTYHLSNRVVVLGRDMRDRLVAKGVPASRVAVVNCWSLDQVNSIAPEENAFRRQHIRDGAFSVMYSGNAGTCHTFGPVIDSARELADDASVQFLFVGGGKRLPEIKKAVGENAPNVSFLPYQEREALAESLSAPDAHIVSLDPRFDGMLVPSKIYGIMASGRPVIFIGSGNNEVARIVREAGCGVIVDPADKGGFTRAIRALQANPAETRAMGERGRAYHDRHFTRGHLVRKFQRLLEAVGLEKGLRGQRVLAHDHVAGHLSPAEPISVVGLAK